MIVMVRVVTKTGMGDNPTYDSWPISLISNTSPILSTDRIKAQEVQDRLPMTYAIYGDQGDYNAQT